MCYCTILCGNCQQRMPIVAGLPCHTDARPGLLSLRHRFTPPFPRVYPSPPGKGVGGISFPFGEGGQKEKVQGRVGRRPKRQAPRGICYPCPGGEDHLKRRSSSPPVPPLLGCRHCPPVNKQKLLVVQVPRGFCPGDARGEAPCIKITLVTPFPAGKGVGGDRGQKEKVQGRVGRRQRRRAPL